MWSYCILYLVVMGCLLISSVGISENKKHKNGNYFNLSVFFYIACFCLYVFSAFRNNVGADFKNYYNIFIQYSQNNAPFDFEPLNMLIINTVNSFGINVHVIFFIYSTIILSGVFYFIVKLSYSKEFSLVIFFLVGIFYLSTLNGIRQWAAVSLLLFSIVSVINKKDIKAFFLVLFAALFHNSAFILFFIVFFLRYRIKLKMMFILSVIILLMTGVINYLITMLGYKRYLIDGLYTQTISYNLLFIYICVFLVVPLLFGYFSNNKKLTTRLIVLLNMNFFSIIILLVGNIIGLSVISIMRLNMYFQLQIIILIPELINILKPIKLRVFIRISVILLLSIYYFYTIYVNGGVYKLTPYNTYLS